MKAIRIHSFGGGDVLRLDELPELTPGEGELLIKVAAASVNPVDAKMRAGSYPAVTAGMLPYTLGRDVAGTIAKIGGGVGDFLPGDAVYSFLAVEHGGYAEYALARPAEVARQPGSTGPVEAAGAALAGITAWQGLFDHGQLKSGQRVLIHGGAGGVGHLAIQLAKARGAWVATTVSGGDLDFVRDLGADLTIDYKAERFEDEVRDLDLVFDLIAGETQDRSFDLVNPGGALISTLRQPSEDKARARGIRAGRYTAQPSGAQLAEIAGLIDQGKIHIHLQKTFPLAEARAAQDYLELEHVRGKVVLMAGEY